MFVKTTAIDKKYAKKYLGQYSYVALMRPTRYKTALIHRGGFYAILTKKVAQILKLENVKPVKICCILVLDKD